jgi:hypothetical protein
MVSVGPPVDRRLVQRLCGAVRNLLVCELLSRRQREQRLLGAAEQVWQRFCIRHAQRIWTVPDLDR